MAWFAGPLWRDGETDLLAVRVERGRVTDQSSRIPPGATPVVILDGLHNFHTHVGDAFLAGRALPHSLDALVRPGTGYKHRMLARARPQRITAGIRRALREHARHGTASVLDFREQGVPGIRLARRSADALGPGGPLVRLLGRPSSWPPRDAEVDVLLEEADGVGVSSISDVPLDSAAQLAAASHAARKPVALHFSEKRREPIESVLSLRPDLLVHGCAARPSDWRALRDAGIPVVVCPSSNRYFRLRPPVAAALRHGVTFFFGTDNAMLGRVDLLGEVALARRWAKGVPDEILLRALTTSPEKAIKRIARVRDESRGRASLVLIPRRGDRVQWGRRPLLVFR